MRPILVAMSEADDLAGRFFALWAEYLTALASNPQASEPLYRWLTLLATAADGFRPSPDAAAVTGTSAERGISLAELARRVDELGERVAVLERRAAAARPRRRPRPARPGRT